MEANLPRKGMKQLDWKGCVWTKPKDTEPLGGGSMQGKRFSAELLRGESMWGV